MVVPAEAGGGGGIEGFAESVSIATGREALQEAAARARVGEIEPQKGTADAFARLAVVKVTEINAVADDLF